MRRYRQCLKRDDRNRWVRERYAVLNHAKRALGLEAVPMPAMYQEQSRE